MGQDWETVGIPFKDLSAPAEGVKWSGDGIVDVRFLIKRPGGEAVWYELDNVRFY